MSVVRRHWARLAVVPVDIGGAWVGADLRTPLGVGLYRYGFCAPEALVCAELLLPGDVFVDGGANIGLFTLRAATVVGSTGRVVACEPGPGTMTLLRANAQRNDFGMVDLHEVALSDASGIASFTIFEDGSGLASFAPQPAGGRAVDVTVTTLDSVTSRFGDQVALVKLDVEGTEVKALRGASALIARSAPLFLIEVEPDHLARQGASIEDLMGVLQPHGYEAYAITPRAHLVRHDGPWCAPDPACPNLVLASPARSARLRDLLTPGPL
ncbi:MAG: FkbM family methyltransferase [Solirubrobacteraceae bacterium]